MKFRAQIKDKAGCLPPDKWTEIDAPDKEAAAIALLESLNFKREDYPVMVFIANDKFLHPNGSPMMCDAYNFELTDKEDRP